MILAGVPRGSTDDADDLYAQHCQLTELLAQADIVPVAYACDGTEVERKLQRLIIARAVAAKDRALQERAIMRPARGVLYLSYQAVNSNTLDILVYVILFFAN